MFEWMVVPLIGVLGAPNATVIVVFWGVTWDTFFGGR